MSSYSNEIYVLIIKSPACIPIALHVLFSCYLDAGQHARGGHAEVQVGQHLRCGGLVDLRRTLTREIVWERMEVKTTLQTYKSK